MQKQKKHEMLHFKHSQIFLLSWNVLLIVAAGSPSENLSRSVFLVSIVFAS